MTVITRFAPSPTGDLHIGGVRAALFSWLFAQHHKGQFILRIEDTDLERSTQKSVDNILESFEWLHLGYEGEPIFQTHRFKRYETVRDELLQKDLAYRCYCSKERLEALRAEQTSKKEKPKYDGHCRELRLNDLARSHVIRFKNPQEGVVEFQDQVRGLVSFQNNELDDVILYRSDGVPTYNFAVVVDDCDMGITHVLRGDDHVNNTPRQINIIKAMGLIPPLYGHLPMILGADGERLSKRHGAVGVLQFRDEGYFREAVLNYLVRLGWSHGDQEIFSLDEMVQLFGLNHLNRAPAKFDYEKLKSLNQHYMKTLDLSLVLERLSLFVQDLSTGQGPDLSAVVMLVRERCKTLVELRDQIAFFYKDPVVEPVLVRAHCSEPVVKDALVFLCERLSHLSDWTVEVIDALIKETMVQFSLKMPQIAKPLRVAITGSEQSPSIAAVVHLLGAPLVIDRVKRVLLTLG